MLDSRKRALIVGHFSTFGDIACLRLVKGLLDELELPYDFSAYSENVTAALPGALPVANIDPRCYSHFLVVCGPVWPGLLERGGFPIASFAHCCRIGVNLTMIEPVADWNPFDYLLERDSDRASTVDLAFIEPDEPTRVIAVCLIEQQPIYGKRQLHSKTIAVVNECLAATSYAILRLDTKWPETRNSYGIRNASEFVALLRGADLLLTNRLHGLVYGAKQPMPVIAIDSVAGGDKVTKQAILLESPLLIAAEDLSVDGLRLSIEELLLSPPGDPAAANLLQRQKVWRNAAVTAMRSAIVDAKQRSDPQRNRNVVVDSVRPARTLAAVSGRLRGRIKSLLIQAAKRL